MWRALEDQLKQIKAEQAHLVEVARPPPPPEVHAVPAPTTPSFLVATQGKESDLRNWILQRDQQW